MVYKLYFNEAGSDVERIIRVALQHGVVLSPIEAERAWFEHSENLAAGWLFLPEDDNDIWYDLTSWARGEK